MVLRYVGVYQQRDHSPKEHVKLKSDGKEDNTAPIAPQSDELLRLIIESAADYAIFSTDQSGIVTSWNVGAERLLGYDTQGIIGRSADLIFTDEDRARGAPEMERRQAAETGRAEDERFQQRQDGSRFWASGLMMPLAMHELGFIKILRDRTAQHDAEARIRESAERFRLLATNIPQLVFMTKPDGVRTWPSPQWINYTGLSFEDSLGLGWLDALHPDDRAATAAAWADAAGQGFYLIEHRLRRSADGEYRWHRTQADPIDSGESADWVGTMTDIHDLRDLSERQTVLIAELQHRTRNLLAVIQAIGSQMLRSATSLPAFKVDFENRLRALSRVQTLLAKAGDQDVDLREMIEDELAAHGAGAIKSGKVASDGPPVALPASSAQALGLAIHELATNAVKHGALAQPAGKLAVTWQVEQVGVKRQVVLNWKERDVAIPNDIAPRKGYGRELIERALPFQLHAKTVFELESDGVRCTISAPLSDAIDEPPHG
jgi:PAS domain S-box-containing protein